MHRRAVLSTTVLIAVFVAGALVGVAAPRVLSSDSETTGAESEAATPSADDDERGTSGALFALARFLDEELGLSDEQRARVEEVLERREEEAREMFLEIRTAFRGHLESTVAEIKSLLTPGQAAEFQRLIDELERRRERYDDRRSDDDRFDRDRFDDDGLDSGRFDSGGFDGGPSDDGPSDDDSF